MESQGLGTDCCTVLLSPEMLALVLIGLISDRRILFEFYLQDLYMVDGQTDDVQ